MATLFDADAGRVDQFRAVPVQALGPFGQTGQGIQFGERVRNRAQARGATLELGDQAVEQGAFAGHGLLAGGEDLVLEALEFLGGVALGVFQGLAAHEATRQLRRARARDLDVIAVYTVIGDLQRGDTRGLALARLDLAQERVGIVLQCPQTIQLGIEAGADHAAVSNAQRGLLDQCGGQGRAQLVLRGQGVVQCLQGRRAGAQRGQGLVQGWQALEARQQGGQVAWPGAAEDDARQDALNIRTAGQGLAQWRGDTRFQQGGDRGLALADDGAVAQGLVQPLQQPPRTHRRAGGVQQG